MDGLTTIRPDLIWICIAVSWRTGNSRLAHWVCNFVLSHATRAVAHHVSFLLKSTSLIWRNCISLRHDGAVKMIETSQN